ncbi:hypothetical protein [Stutzerimonas decontaminans]|uniref:hypothetical protein n=1 Tax=Stutzerimonas decontaminans TaxID=3022791 RepID=UPI0011AFC4BD|nr:hypothetical protein [Stutzerimonas decontaminans]MCQ4243422.1 hypothetical protein [Stutzerimonas decontaminans]
MAVADAIGNQCPGVVHAFDGSPSIPLQLEKISSSIPGVPMINALDLLGHTVLFQHRNGTYFATVNGVAFSSHPDDGIAYATLTLQRPGSVSHSAEAELVRVLDVIGWKPQK